MSQPFEEARVSVHVYVDDDTLYRWTFGLLPCLVQGITAGVQTLLEHEKIFRSGLDHSGMDLQALEAW